MTRFEHFVEQLRADTYPEPITDGHQWITQKMIEKIAPMLPEKANVLDVGCGQGVALKEFARRKFQAIGLTTNPEDQRVCFSYDYFVYNMDMHAMPLTDKCFDLVWARHVLEHSAAPYFVLHEFHRVCKPGGLLYVEVPAPDTSCHHETNKNHYSCLPRTMWNELIVRSGFSVLDHEGLALTTPVGPDEYWFWICKK